LQEDVVKEGQVLKEQLEEQKKAVAALRDAIKERTLDGMQVG
jgi:hypothetical protein